MDRATLAAALLAAGQILSAAQFPGPPAEAPAYTCAAERCIRVEAQRAPAFNTSSCDSKCEPLLPREWLAYKAHWSVTGERMTAIVATTLKKSELNAKFLPPAETRPVAAAAVIDLTAAVIAADGDYWLVMLQSTD